MRSVGYSHLIERFNVPVVPNWHTSAVTETTGGRRTRETAGQVFDAYPASYWPGDSAGEQLEFALKYDGTNLQILNAVFAVLPEDELTSYVQSKPWGKYARRLWFLYEWCTGRTLSVPQLSTGTYVPVVEPDEQYTTAGFNVPRQRVICNLLGDRAFCPAVRRTEPLLGAEQSRLDERSRRVIAACPPEILRRAMQYLYTKETRSSYEIEREQPTADRTLRFVNLLHAAERDDYAAKAMLVALQNQIVDPRFRESDYRQVQNYVGQSVGMYADQKVHLVPPWPADVPPLMAGWEACHRSLAASDVHPVVHAAVVAYAFVFIHPFEDGNGRSHRFLIHNVLARRGFTPAGVVLPVSAVMSKDPTAYDRSLEAFSRPVLDLADYTLDEQARMTVRNDLSACYRFMDLTPQAEALFDFVRVTVERELVEEIRFLRYYDRAKRAVQDVADLPDRMIDLFLRCCGQNGFRLSRRKRETAFQQLTDDEVERMEAGVRRAHEAAGQDGSGDDDES